MKRASGFYWIITFAFFAFLSRNILAEDFKGTPSNREYTLGAMAGAGVVGTSYGFSLQGAAAKKIINHGFIPDINDQVFIEAEFGPVFITDNTTWEYSAHLRWDFQKDEEWTFFALGGFGGDLGGNGNSAFYPRFGLGAFWNVSPTVTLRGEISHEFIGAGVSFPF